MEIKKKHIYLALFGVFIGYIALRYYLKPGYLSQERFIMMCTITKPVKLSPQKKIIKDINFEFIHDDIEMKPSNGQWKESIRTDIDEYGSHRILHDPLLIKVKRTFFDVGSIGPAFSERI